MSVVEIIDPMSSGTQWDVPVSMVAASAMMVLVRSARSFLPKKDSGRRRSFSASAILRRPLSRYTVTN